MAFIGRSDRDGVATLVLARPPINALDRAALDELGEAIGAIEADPAIRALVLASGIEGIFCAGGDLKFWRRFPREMAREVSRSGREVFERIERLPQPTLAVLEGQVIGDGLALALAADLRVASEAASFRVPEADSALFPPVRPSGRRGSWHRRFHVSPRSPSRGPSGCWCRSRGSPTAMRGKKSASRRSGGVTTGRPESRHSSRSGRPALEGRRESRLPERRHDLAR